MVPVPSFAPFGGANALLSQPQWGLGQNRAEVSAVCEVTKLAGVHRGLPAPHSPPCAGPDADQGQSVV